MFKHKKYGNIEYFNSHSISVLFFHNTNRKRQRLQHKASVAFPHSCCPEASGKIYHRPQRLHITQEMLFGACCCSSALTFFLLILHFVVIHGILLDHFVRFFLPSAQRKNGRESVCNRHQHQRSKDLQLLPAERPNRQEFGRRRGHMGPKDDTVRTLTPRHQVWCVRVCVCGGGGTCRLCTVSNVFDSDAEF